MKKYKVRELITLDQYFNLVGGELFPDFSPETVFYFSERKKELKHLRHQALATYKIANNRIWSDGEVKVSLRLEQGYIDPPFAIEEFHFAQSGCISKDGGWYRCRLEVNNDARGRPKHYEFEDVIREYVFKHYTSQNVLLSKISADSVISYVQDYHQKQNIKVPSPNTVRNKLHQLYPECKKASRNSKK